jgi:hypothetical protein
MTRRFRNTNIAPRAIEMVSALARRPLRLCRAFKGLASRGYAAFEQLETARHLAVAPVSDLQPSRMTSVFILPRLHRLHSSRWPGCGRSPTGPPDTAVKHARRAFPAPGLLSQTGMEPVTRDSVQHTSPSRRKAASWGPRASQRPSPRVNPGPSACHGSLQWPRAHRKCSRSLLLELSSRANYRLSSHVVENLFSNP